MTAWIVGALAAYPLILAGLIESTVGAFAGLDARLLGPILVIVGALMSFAAGIFAYVLGGRSWAAVLTAVPGIAVSLGFVLQQLWLYAVVFASPLAILAGIASVAVSPRPPARAPAIEPGEPGRPKPDRVARWLADDTSTPGPELSKLAPGERDWIDGCLASVVELGCDIDDLEQIRSLYERSMTDWHAEDPKHRDDPSATINMIGAAFGEHLVRATPLHWVVATDEYGVSDLALNDTRTAALVYPAKEVAKAWVAGDSGEFLTTTARAQAAE